MDSENNKVFYTNPVEASQASLRIDKYIAGPGFFARSGAEAD